jgi:hypothetical protein
MQLEVLRISSQEDSTSGILFDVSNGERKFLCYTLEDEYREDKISGETRVPKGTYKLELRKVGGFDSRYKKKFSFHKGMLEVRDVPNFQYILIHIGNTDENTAGCLLVGDTQNSNLIEKDGFIGSSTNAYKKIYPPIAKAIEDNEEVTITYIDYDGKIVSKSKVRPTNLMINNAINKRVEQIEDAIEGVKKVIDSKID